MSDIVVKNKELQDERRTVYLERNKRADISLMRIAATLVVVFIHTCNTLANNSESFALSSNLHIMLNCCYSMMHWAVPLFFMITGALLLQKEKKLTIQLCVNKYVKRIVIALFVFGIPFSLMEIVMVSKTFSIENLWGGGKTGTSWRELGAFVVPI